MISYKISAQPKWSRSFLTVRALRTLRVIDGELVVASFCVGSVSSSERNESVAIVVLGAAVRSDDDGATVAEVAVAPALEKELLQKIFISLVLMGTFKRTTQNATLIQNGPPL